jgi:hypothetical protein
MLFSPIDYFMGYKIKVGLFREESPDYSNLIFNRSLIPGRVWSLVVLICPLILANLPMTTECYLIVKGYDLDGIGTFP